MPLLLQHRGYMRRFEERFNQLSNLNPWKK